MSLQCAIVSTLVVALTSAQYAHRTGTVPTCPADSPDLNSCVRAAIQQLVPYLARGVPSIGAAPTDPLQKLPPLVYKRPTGDFEFHMDNIVIKGLANAVIDGAQVDLAGNTIRIQSHVPAPLVVDGDSATNGEIAGVPIRGNGFYRLTTNGAQVDVTLQGQPVTGPNGQTFLDITSASVKLDVGTPTLEVEGFYNNFPPLVRAANAFINTVSSSVLAEMDATLEAWLSSIFLERSRSVFSTVSYDTLFAGRTPAAYGLLRAIHPHY